MKFSEFIEIFQLWRQVEKYPNMSFSSTLVPTEDAKFTEADIEKAKAEARLGEEIAASVNPAE